MWVRVSRRLDRLAMSRAWVVILRFFEAKVLRRDCLVRSTASVLRAMRTMDEKRWSAKW